MALLVMVWPSAQAAIAPASNASAELNATATPAQLPTFTLNELRVLHNSVLSPLDIARLLYPFLGPNKTLGDVESARVALEAEYHAKGYGTVYVDIPDQTVGNDGVVRLSVTEAKLQRTRITGAKYFANGQIRAAVPEAEEGNVPNLPRLQAQVTAVNAITADRVVTPVLKAGSEPGTMAVELKVDDTLPLHGSLELNNQYTADTRPLRLLGSLRYDNAFARQDSVSLQYQTAPQEASQVRVFASSYVLRLSDDNKLALTYIDSSSNVATVGDITVAGKGKTYSAQLLHNVELSTRVISSLQFGASFKDSLQNVLLGSDTGLTTPVKYTTLQAAYNWLLRAEPRLWTWNNSLTLGVPGLGDDTDEFANKCYGCKAGFLVWRSDASVTQPLPADFSALLSLSGQYSPEPLISNEQLLIGGAHSVRGYLESEETGDAGVRAALELHAPNWVPTAWHWQLLPYVFYDWAQVSFRNPLPGQERSRWLASAGAGVDLALGTHVSGTLVYGKPLKDGSNTIKGEGRFQFAIRGTW